MQPWELSLSQASAQLARRECSAAELVRAMLERTAACDGRLGAFAEVFAEDALRWAEQADAAIAANGQRTPLHGVPIAVKDLYDVAGARTGAGSALRADHVAATDAAVVTALRAAGAIIVGKTQTHEFAFGITTPRSRNPWDPARTPGGSSGGSAAAVAARMVPAAIGTDTGGSIRIPAALCGVVGLKPTYGSISTDGLTPLSWSMDHAGPIARTVRDIAVVADQLAEWRPAPDCSAYASPLASAVDTVPPDLSGVRVGVPDNFYFERCHPHIERVVRAAIEMLGKLGADLRAVNVPLPQESVAAGTLIIGAEAASYHEPDLRTRAHMFTQETREKLLNGALVLAKDYVSAQRARTLIARAWRELLSDVDVVAAPVTAAPAAVAGATSVRYPDGSEEPITPAYSRLCLPGNVSGLPAVAQPCGFTPDGMPVGWQLIGRPYGEAALLRIARVYESATTPPGCNDPGRL